VRWCARDLSRSRRRGDVVRGVQLHQIGPNEWLAGGQGVAAAREADVLRNRLHLMSPVGKTARPLDLPLKDSAKGLIHRLNLTDRPRLANLPSRRTISPA
jgi:hypothetical protein